MFRRDELSSNFIDIELGELEPLNQLANIEGVFDLCPDEILLELIKHMSVNTLISLAKTCHRFHNIIPDYMMKNKEPEFRAYRIGLFKHQQTELNDDIDEAHSAKVKTKNVIIEFALGTPLTGLSSRALKTTFGSPHLASRDEKIIVAIFFIVTVAILLAGFISVLYNIKLNFDVSSASKKIEELENKIRDESTALRKPSAPKF